MHLVAGCPNFSFVSGTEVHDHLFLELERDLYCSYCLIIEIIEEDKEDRRDSYFCIL
jgi:hypothetical protein